MAPEGRTQVGRMEEKMRPPSLSFNTDEVKVKEEREVKRKRGEIVGRKGAMTRMEDEGEIEKN